MKRLLTLLWFFSSAALAVPVFNSVSANSTTIQRLDKYELSFSLSGTTYSNPYDPGQIDVSATFTDPNGVSKTVNGFIMRNYTKSCVPTENLSSSSLAWHVRFSPDIVGAWSVTLKAVDSSSGTGTAGPYAFTCSSSTKKGFVRVSPVDNRYFQYDDGSQFIPIGQNLAWSTTGSYYSCDFDNWQPKIASNGGNMMRWWFATFNTAVEWDENSPGHSVLGDYTNLADQHWRADYILEQAKSDGLEVMVTLMNMGDLRGSGFENKWGYNVYNSAKGGPCANPWDFFTNASAQTYFKRRLRYIVARWGYLPNIVWETFNEMDFTDGYNSTNIKAWHNVMLPYLKQYDLDRHMISVSFSDPSVEDSNIFSLSNIAFTGFHRYSSSATMEDEHLATVLNHRSAYGKPVLGGETGIAGGSTVSADPTGVHFHNSAWGGLASGAAGTPLFWDWNNYIDPLNLYTQYQGMANFAAALDYQNSAFVFQRPAISTSTYKTLTVIPGYSNWAQGPVLQFNVAASGDVSPDASQMNQYLHEQGSGPSYYDPLSFTVSYANAGTFAFNCVNNGGSNNVQVRIDGSLVFAQNLGIGGNYSTPVSAGNHVIRIDNNGSNWAQIGHYDFTNYVPSIKAYVLQGPTTIAGWTVNRDYNYVYVKASGVPAAISGAVIHLTGTANGLWDVEWWNTFTGVVASTATGSSVGNLMDLTVPSMSKDWAFRVRLSGTIPTATPTMTATPNWTATATPSITPSPSATPSATQTPIVCGPDWGFDDGTVQGWQRDTVYDAGFTSIAASSTQVFSGVDSLQLNADFHQVSASTQGGVVSVVGLANGFPRDLTGRTVTAKIYVPAGMSPLSTPNGAFIYVKTGAGYTWNQGAWTNLVTYSAWVNLSFSMASVSNPADVRELGIKVGLAGAAPDWSGTLYLDHIDLGAGACATNTPTPSPSFTISPTPSGSRTPSSTPSASPSHSPSATPSASPSATPSITDVPPGSTLTNTPSISVTSTISPSSSVTPSPVDSATPSSTLTASATQTVFVSSTPSLTPSVTLVVSATFTRTATPTFSATPTFTATLVSTVAVATATPTSAASAAPSGAFGSVAATQPGLNPQAGSILRVSAQLSGVVQELEITLYSAGYQRTVTQVLVGPWNAGWHALSLPVGELANGVYFYRVQARNLGKPAGHSKVGTFVILN